MIVDRQLMERLESTAATCGVDTVDAFRAVDPSHPAKAQEIGPGALVSWGPERFVNRAIGASLQELDDVQLDEFDTFFDVGGVPASIEVNSWTNQRLITQLVARGYVPVRFNDVLVIGVRPADTTPTPHPAVAVRRAAEIPKADWQRLFVDAFETASPDLIRITDELTEAITQIQTAVHLVAEIDGAPVGVGSLYPQNDIAWIGGAATLPGFRRRGVQASLLAERLTLARANGCAVLAATAMAGSGSSRNMQRNGFTICASVLIMTRP